MTRKDLARRLTALETVTEEEPLVIFINCVDASSPTRPGSAAGDPNDLTGLRSALIAGTAKQSGPWMDREQGETEDAFLDRVRDQCRQVHGMAVEVELHGDSPAD